LWEQREEFQVHHLLPSCRELGQKLGQKLLLLTRQAQKYAIDTYPNDWGGRNTHRFVRVRVRASLTVHCDLDEPTSTHYHHDLLYQRVHRDLHCHRRDFHRFHRDLQYTLDRVRAPEAFLYLRQTRHHHHHHHHPVKHDAHDESRKTTCLPSRREHHLPEICGLRNQWLPLKTPHTLPLPNTGIAPDLP
jgi:hypothetical protein